MNKPLLILCFFIASFGARGYATSDKTIQITGLQVDKSTHLISKYDGSLVSILRLENIPYLLNSSRAT
ncbi:hypothetical protein SRABI04_00659 [Chryseobacterium sp. Bi04]|nr:hypothetical protein SRABI04_00659 [Chryseobacterium sp. Bi04]